MPVNSRAKGAKGELEVVKIIRQYGFEAKRSQQHSGAAGDEDVFHNIPGVYLEVKFYKDCQLFSESMLDDWRRKVMEDAQDSEAKLLKVIVHRWNGQAEWYAICFGQPNTIFGETVIMKFGALLRLIKRGKI